MAWRDYRLTAPKPLSLHHKFIIEEGLDIHKKARQLFPDGVLIKGDNISAAKRTAELLINPKINTLFEGTFIIHHGITKADIIRKNISGLELYEIKSGLDPQEKYVDDLAYTTMVCIQAGLPLSKCSLLLLNRDYRFKMPVQTLFQEYDCTDEVLSRA